MKYIKKFESSTSKKEDTIDYINECFIDIIDRGATTESDDYESIFEYSLSINVPYNGTEERNIKDIIKLSDDIKENLLEVENCINKIKILYPNIKYICDLVQDTNNSDAVVFDNIIYISLYIEKNPT